MFEIASPIQKLSDAGASHFIEFHIDARPFGKRRKSGFTDFIRVIPLEDGGIKVSSLRNAVFGNGYGKKLDRRAIKTQRAPLPGGGERISVTLPRDFFYLHEWALGNGNSQLGINARVMTQNKDSKPKVPFPPSTVNVLVDPDLGRYNAEALGVLELTDKPTKRWSARLY